jgi:hypothetical protein
MAVPGWLKDAIATPRGFISKKGELLKAQRMTAQQCDEFNHRDKPEPKTITLDLSTPVPTVASEPVVEVVEVKEEVDLKSMTKAQLVEIAKERGIDTNGLSKTKVLEALQ